MFEACTKPIHVVTKIEIFVWLLCIVLGDGQGILTKHWMMSPVLTQYDNSWVQSSKTPLSYSHRFAQSNAHGTDSGKHNWKSLRTRWIMCTGETFISGACQNEWHRRFFTGTLSVAVTGVCGVSRDNADTWQRSRNRTLQLIITIGSTAITNQKLSWSATNGSDVELPYILYQELLRCLISQKKMLRSRQTVEQREPAIMHFECDDFGRWF